MSMMASVTAMTSPGIDTVSETSIGTVTATTGGSSHVMSTMSPAAFASHDSPHCRLLANTDAGDDGSDDSFDDVVEPVVEPVVCCVVEVVLVLCCLDSSCVVCVLEENDGEKKEVDYDNGQLRSL